MADAPARTLDELLDDRSTQARIRDAALEEFAEHGFKGASIRAIAKRAGVSAGAVQTHFATKDALRQACDAYVLAVVRVLKRQMAADVGGADPSASPLADPARMAGVDRVMQRVLGYLATAMVSGSDTADWWFDEFYGVFHDILTDQVMGPGLSDSRDSRDIAAVLTAMQLGLMMLFDRVLQAMGTAPGDPQAMVRVGRARLFLATERFVSAELEGRSRAALDNYEQAYGAAARPAAAPAQEGDDE